MAKSITKDPNKIALNDQYYTLKSPLRAQYVSRMPGKVNIGPDSYDREQMLSNWNIKDLRAGLGREEMDEKVDFDRYWWGNLICDFEGHILLPRLATEISTFNALDVTPTWTDPTGSIGTDWSGRPAAYNNNTTDYSYITVGISSWSAYYIFTVPAKLYGQFRIYPDRTNVAITTMSIDAWDGYEWISIYSATPTYGGWVTIDHTDRFYSQARVRFYNSSGATAYTARIHDADAETCDSSAVSGNISHFANFNGEQYVAIGNYLLKLDAGRASYTCVEYLPTTITALIPSLSSKLYIFMGDNHCYCTLNTSDFLEQNITADAYWGFQYDNKLFKVNSSGACAYSSDPASSSPTWTSIGSITDIASQIARFFVGKDASGEEVVCCATKSWFKVLAIGSTFANSVWVNTAVKLPDHPNGGKGACYWHGAHYISYGLGVKKYVSGSTATITEVGLNKDDGLPVEFNGEIVKFGEDSAMDVLFALVDASQTSGNSKSGLYAYTGMGWRCWWYDSANNGAMYDVMVSSAESEYAVYWVCGGSVFYIDIHRGISNPKQLAGTQKYESAGILISPIFDADAAAMKKLIKRVRDYAKSVTTTETIIIYYRIDRATQDVDLDLSGSHWTILADLDTTAEAGEVTTEFASGAGVAVNAIQFRIDMARGGTNTLSPDLQSMVTSYRKLTKGNWVYTAPIVIDGLHNRTKKEQHEDLESAAISETDVALIYRSTAKYVQVMLPQSWKQTGTNYGGEYTLSLIEA